MTKLKDLQLKKELEEGEKKCPLRVHPYGYADNIPFCAYENCTHILLPDEELYCPCHTPKQEKESKYRTQFGKKVLSKLEPPQDSTWEECKCELDGFQGAITSQNCKLHVLKQEKKGETKRIWYQKGYEEAEKKFKDLANEEAMNCDIHATQARTDTLAEVREKIEGKLTLLVHSINEARARNDRETAHDYKERYLALDDFLSSLQEKKSNE